jgi:hypothetical protein
MVFRNGQPARYVIDGLSFNALYFKVSLALILAFGNFSDIHIVTYIQNLGKITLAAKKNWLVRPINHL